jgi:ATP-dependent helicase HrpB
VPLALQLALWGSPLGEGLPWLDAPAAATLQEARLLLLQLGALERDGQLSHHGRRMGQLGLHPRLAHMLLLAAERGWQHLAADLAVLLSERDPLDRAQAGSDLQSRLAWLQQPQPHDRQWQRLRQQQQALVRQLAPSGLPQPLPAEAASLLVSWAYPDRIAVNRGDGQGRFVLRSGPGAAMPLQDPLAGLQALAVASLDGNSNEARILLALPLAIEHVLDLAVSEGQLQPMISWDRQAQRVRCEQQLRLGALVLERRPWADPDPEAVLAVLLPQLRSRGLEALPWTNASRQLQQRLQLAHQHIGSPWPARDDTTLLANLEAWLGPQLLGLSSLEGLRSLDLEEALWADLPWERRQELETLLPTSVTIASGRRAKLDYGQGRPVLAVKLQELFGTLRHPALLAGALAIRIELLDPAGRPAAISEDLPLFWQQTYPLVRKELRGRYPKHPWPLDPTQAVATPLTNRQLRSTDPVQRSDSR